LIQNNKPRKPKHKPANEQPGTSPDAPTAGQNPWPHHPLRYRLNRKNNMLKTCDLIKNEGSENDMINGGKSRATLKQIAKYCGVSHTTVSMVITKSPHLC